MEDSEKCWKDAEGAFQILSDVANNFIFTF